MCERGRRVPHPAVPRAAMFFDSDLPGNRWIVAGRRAGYPWRGVRVRFADPHPPRVVRARARGVSRKAGVFHDHRGPFGGNRSREGIPSSSIATTKKMRPTKDTKSTKSAPTVSLSCFFVPFVGIIFWTLVLKGPDGRLIPCSSDALAPTAGPRRPRTGCRPRTGRSSMLPCPWG